MKQPEKTSSTPINDLLTPSVQHIAAPDHSRPLPWRLNSQVWIAFFGGVLPYGYIACQNSQRLGEGSTARQRLIILTVIGLVLTIALNWVLLHADMLAGAKDGTIVRLSSRIVAVLAYLIGKRWQTPADRAHMFTDRGYASLWKTGFVVTLLLGFLQNIIVWIISR